MFKPYFPPHIYQDETIYFITAHTRDNHKILSSGIHKKILWSVFNESLINFGIECYAWTINTNHYHVLVQILRSTDLPKFIQKFHGKTSFLLNKFDRTRGRKIWTNYWDRCIRSELDFYTRLNYIHYNPVKHYYVSKPDEYQWSSYKFYQEKYGPEWLAECFTKYPIKEFVLECPD